MAIRIPIAAARDIRDTFGRMAMNDEETVAPDRRWPHLRQDARRRPRRATVGAEPEAADIDQQGFGWENRFGTGKGADTITSGLEVTWTTTPTKWGNNFFENLFGFERGAHQEPGRCAPVGGQERRERASSPTPTIPPRSSAPTMLTTDLAAALRPGATKRSRAASSRTRISSPTRSPAPGSSSRTATWARVALPRPARSRPRSSSGRTPIPAVDHPLIDDARYRRTLKTKILASGLSRLAAYHRPPGHRPPRSVAADKRGGANGARIRLAPQKDWEVNQPAQLAKVLEDARGRPEASSTAAQPGGKKVSLADLIVLAGVAGR